MNFFLISAKINAKKLLMRRALWVTSLGLFAILIFAGVLRERMHTPLLYVTVGVVYNSEAPHAREIFDALSQTSTPLVNFTLYNDLDLLFDDIRFGRIECGYIIDTTITVVSAPSVGVAPLINEIVTAAVFSVHSEYIVADWLEYNFNGDENTRAFVAQHFAMYAESDIFMQPLFFSDFYEMVETRAADIVFARISLGLVGFAVMLVTLFAVSILADERRGWLARTLKICNKLALYDFSWFAVLFATAFFIGATGIIVASISFPELLNVFSVLVLLCYTALCATLAVIVARWQKITELVLFFVILNTIFGGVILDLYEISPVLGRMQYVFPLYWYITLALPF